MLTPLSTREPQIHEESRFWFYEVLMLRNAIRLAIKSLDRKTALEFKKREKKQDTLMENVRSGMSCKVKFKLTEAGIL